MYERRYPVLIEATELYKRISDNDPTILVLDVRREEEYLKERIPSAFSLPFEKVMESMDALYLATLFASAGLDIDNDVEDESKHVILYDDALGVQASRVSWTLEYLGYEKVSLLAVTYSMWKKLGLPVDYSGVSNRVSTSLITNVDITTRHRVEVNEGVIADDEYIYTILLKRVFEEKTGKSKLLDVRERLEFLDHHIMNAINIPWKAFTAEDRILKQKEEIVRLLKNRKIGADDEIVVYDESGGTMAALSYYALKLAGCSNVRLYAKPLKECKVLDLPLGEFKDAHYRDLAAE
jgi:thiosulfate/3-mercaptopyruvate sulfurtransferase